MQKKIWDTSKCGRVIDDCYVSDGYSETQKHNLSYALRPHCFILMEVMEIGDNG